MRKMSAERREDLQLWNVVYDELVGVKKSNSERYTKEYKGRRFNSEDVFLDGSNIGVVIKDMQKNDLFEMTTKIFGLNIKELSPTEEGFARRVMVIPEYMANLPAKMFVVDDEPGIDIE